MSEEFTWLNMEILTKVVQNHFAWSENEFIVETFDISRASGKGDNYLGTLLRVRVEIVKKTAETLEWYYIVKTSAGDGNTSEEISSLFGVYPKEKEVYSKILPAFETIWREVGIDVTFGPRCYGVFEDPVDIIVLEDLKQTGFAIGDRFVGLELEHALLAVEKASQFHAASLIYLEKHGKFDEKFNDGLFAAKMYTGEWKQYYQALSQSFIDTLVTWPDCEKIVEKVKLCSGNLYMYGVKATEINPGDFGCLVHGDMWLNNMMFRETSEGKPEEVKLIDYQITCWSSPTQDLFYFITNSLKEDVRVEEFDTIVVHYQESLERSLKLLQYSGHIPSLHEIQSEMLKRSMMAVSCIVEGLPTILINKGESLNMNLFLSDNDEAEKYRRKMYSSPRFVNATQKYLKFLYKRGMIDV